MALKAVDSNSISRPKVCPVFTQVDAGFSLLYTGFYTFLKFCSIPLNCVIHRHHFTFLTHVFLTKYYFCDIIFLKIVSTILYKILVSFQGAILACQPRVYYSSGISK